MNIWEALFKTYDTAVNGDFPDKLIPIAHNCYKADIEITIDAQGNFIRAEAVKQETTCVPTTDSSGGRTNGCAPHPLCDKIQYIAGDYNKYLPGKSYFDDIAVGKKKREGYFTILRNWELFSNNPILVAVRSYVEKRTVISDLITSGIFCLDDTGKLVWNSSKDLRSAFVRWIVRTGQPDEETWKNKELQEDWIRYYSSLNNKEAICNVTGELMPCASNHPCQLRYPGDKAKLISSNDSAGFTYRGLFGSATEVSNMGWEVTQKIHAVLRWLIARQGIVNDTQIILVWSINNIDVPDILSSTEKLASIEDWFSLEEPTIATDMGQSTAMQVKKRIAGFNQEIKANDDIVVAIIDSVTKGRMAIKYYSEMPSTQLFARINKFHQRYSWEQKINAKKVIFGVPSVYDIARVVCYKTLEKPKHENSKYWKSVIAKITSSIVDDGIPLPYEIIKQVCNQAVHPVGKELWEYDAIMRMACGLYNGSLKNGGFQMALEENVCDRSYLFGRLLAVANEIERYAQFIADKTMRETNAVRLMSAYQARPAQIWQRIDSKLSVYKNQLRKAKRFGALNIYEQELEKIMSLFNYEDFISNQPLDPKFCIGYYCQKEALRFKEKNSAENKAA